MEKKKKIAHILIFSGFVACLATPIACSLPTVRPSISQWGQWYAKSPALWGASICRPQSDHAPWNSTSIITRAVLVMHVAYWRTSRQIIGLGIADCTLLLIQRFDLLSITSLLKLDTVHHPVKCSSFQGDAHHSMLGTKLQCFVHILRQVVTMLEKSLELLFWEAVHLCLFKSTLHGCLFPELYNMHVI